MAAAAGAQTLMLNPTIDTFVSSANPNSNYGAAGALEVSATGSAKGNFDALMQFNLSAAAGLNVQSITLTLTTASPNNALFNSPNVAGQFDVIWMQNAGWTEGNGTPAAASTTGGLTYSDSTTPYQALPSFTSPSDELLGTFTSNAVTISTSTYTLALPSGFLNAVESGSTAVSLEIVPVDNSVSYLFYSENFGTPANRPVLTVAAVPEPAGIGLLAMGLAGAAAAWRSTRPARGLKRRG